MKVVLLIDDDELFLTMMRQLLEDSGYRVHSTADGPQGIDIFKERRPDLVLLDLGLPSMSGIEVLKEMKHLDIHAKVIVISGYAEEQFVKSAMENGACDFIEKSIDPKDMLQRIHEGLETP